MVANSFPALFMLNLSVRSVAVSSPGANKDPREVVELARQINFEVDSDDVRELLDSYNQELAIDELIEMHEQDIEELESLDPVQSEDRMTFGNLTEGFNLIEIGGYKF
ncbi:hypothetical protein TNCV_545511 [Trichonephila clavipes]|nr:hypothetical protein TNCV_545511 [Trichonephila clavipes]